MSNSLRLMVKKKPVVVFPRQDARIEDLEKNCNIGASLIDHAVADEIEILQRQSICKWMLKNPKVMDSAYFTEADGMLNTFPQNAEGFLTYAKQLRKRKTEFWNRVNKFIEVSDSLYGPPKRVSYLLNHLEREGEVKYNEESELTEEILSELRKTITVAGLVMFTIVPDERSGIVASPWRVNLGTPSDLPYKDIKSFGAWAYHPKLDPDDDPSKNFLESGLEKIKLKSLSNWIREKRYVINKESAIIRKTPKSIMADIAMYLGSFFTPKNGFYGSTSFQVYIAYTFDQSGLHITLHDWNLFTRIDTKASGIKSLDFGEAGGTELSTGLRKKLSRFHSSREVKKQQALLNEWFLRHESAVRIDSSFTHEIFSAPRFDEVRIKYSKRINQIVEWQKKSLDAFKDLKVLRSMLVGIRDSGEKFVFPEFTAEDQVLVVDHLFPARVSKTPGHKRVPFGNILLNGKIVNITGRNNSGKSTLMLSLLDLILKAQNGLPVFARYARLSVRTHFAMSFLDRDSHLSTFTAKTKKDMAILSLLTELTPKQLKKVLIFVDELGSATDQVGVIDVVKPFIDCLTKAGISVVMSTQIPDVSAYLESSKFGCNYRFVGKYQLEEGIGYAEPVEVAKELGYFALLDKIKASTSV